MTFTIDIQSNPLVGVTDADVDAASGDAVDFTVEGTVRVTDELLGAFAGARLTPRELKLDCGDGPPVAVQLDEEGAGLRLDEVDVGVERPGEGAPDPDVGDLKDTAASGDDAVPDASIDAVAGRVAFTVEGVVDGVPEDAVDQIEAGEARPIAITFAVDESVETDGGSPGSPLAEFELIGFRIAVRANGTIVVTATDGLSGVGPL